MTITVKWENTEQTVILLHFDGAYTWDELQAAQEQASELMYSITHDVHVISDLSLVKGLPSGAFAKTQTHMRFTPPNTSHVILVGANLMVRSFMQMYQKIFPVAGQKFSFAATVEEAHALLPTHS